MSNLREEISWSDDRHDDPRVAEDFFAIFREIRANEKERGEFVWNYNRWATLSNTSFTNLAEIRTKWFHLFRNSEVGDFFLSTLFTLNALIGCSDENFTLPFVAFVCYVLPVILFTLLTFWIHRATQIWKPFRKLYETIRTMSKCLRVSQDKSEKCCDLAKTSSGSRANLQKNSTAFYWKRFIVLPKISIKGILLGIVTFVLVRDTDFYANHEHLIPLFLFGAVLVSTLNKCVRVIIFLFKTFILKKNLSLRMKELLLWFQNDSKLSNLCSDFCFLNLKFLNFVDFQDTECPFSNGECSFLTVWFVVCLGERSRIGTDLDDVFPSDVLSSNEYQKDDELLSKDCASRNSTGTVHVPQEETTNSSQTSSDLSSTVMMYFGSNSNKEQRDAVEAACANFCSTPTENFPITIAQCQGGRSAMNEQNLRESKSHGETGYYIRATTEDQFLTKEIKAASNNNSSSSCRTIPEVNVNGSNFLRKPKSSSNIVLAPMQYVAGQQPNMFKCHHVQSKHISQGECLPFQPLADVLDAGSSLKEPNGRALEGSTYINGIKPMSSRRKLPKTTSRQTYRISHQVRTKRKISTESSDSKSSLGAVRCKSPIMIPFINNLVQRQAVDVMSPNFWDNDTKSVHDLRNTPSMKLTGKKDVDLHHVLHRRTGKKLCKDSDLTHGVRNTTGSKDKLNAKFSNFRKSTALRSQIQEIDVSHVSLSSRSAGSDNDFDTEVPLSKSPCWFTERGECGESSGDADLSGSVSDSNSNISDCKVTQNDGTGLEDGQSLNTAHVNPTEGTLRKLKSNISDAQQHSDCDYNLLPSQEPQSDTAGLSTGEYNCIIQPPNMASKDYETSSTSNSASHQKFTTTGKESYMEHKSCHDVGKESEMVSEASDFPMPSSEDENFRFHPETGCSSDTSYTEIHREPQKPIVMWKSKGGIGKHFRDPGNMDAAFISDYPVNSKSIPAESHGHFKYDNFDFEFSYKTRTESLTFKFYCESEGEFDESTPRLERGTLPLFAVDDSKVPRRKHKDFSHSKNRDKEANTESGEGKTGIKSSSILHGAGEIELDPNQEGSSNPTTVPIACDPQISEFDDFNPKPKVHSKTSSEPKCLSEEISTDEKFPPDTETLSQFDDDRTVHFQADNITFKYHRLRNTGALKLHYHKWQQQKDFLFKSRFKRFRFRCGNVRPRHATCQPQGEREIFYSGPVDERPQTENSELY